MMEFADHVRRQWFAVARSAALRDKPVRVFLLGWPIVLARSERGTVIALEDRCPHRGVPLSDGRIGPKGLTCRFHGWTFDESGRCTGLPGMTESEPPLGEIRVPAFTVIERDGLVWAARSVEYPLPERLAVLKPENFRFVWEGKLAAPVTDAQSDILEALLSGTAPELEVEGDGFMVDHQGRSIGSGFLVRFFESRRTGERAYFSSLSTAQLEYRYANGGTVWITLSFSPETLVSTRVFATLHARGRWLPEWLVNALISPVLRTVEAQARTASDARSSAASPFGPIRRHLQRAWSTARIADDVDAPHPGHDEGRALEGVRRV